MLRLPVRSPRLLPPRVLAFGAGVMIDAVLGDPPNALHPVAWFGSAARVVERRVLPASRPACAGAIATAALVLGTAAAAGALERSWPRAFGGREAAGAVLLATASAQSTLFARAEEIAAALDADDLPAARDLLGRHLVSRSTEDLRADEVAAATIESVAENLSDGVVAPWCWFALCGGAGAWAYRALNTLDAMWGYRTPRYEAFGRVAARADDAANLLPARLTALALTLGAPVVEGTVRSARAGWRQDAARTASPNAGHPMAAMAGALGVTLEKRGAYRLGGGRPPTARDIRRAVTLARASGAGIAVAIFTVIAVRSACVPVRQCDREASA